MDPDRSVEPQLSPGPASTALRIAALYALVGGLWILFSDSALLFLVRDPTTMARVAIAKGWVYVAVTAAMLFLLVRGALSRLGQSQEALRRNEDAYRLLVEHQTDLVVQMDHRGSLLFVSPSCCELFDKTQEELLGAPFLPLVHYADRSAVEETIRAFSWPPHTGYVEHRALTAQGWRWIAWAGKAVLDAHGRVGSIAAVGRDITDKRAAEEALEGHTRRLEALKDIEEAILSARSPQEVAKAAVAHLRRLVRCRRVSVIFAEGMEGAVSVVADDLDPAAPQSLEMAGEVFGEPDASREFSVERVDDLSETPRSGPLFDHLRSLGLRSAITAPLVTEGEVVGLLALASEAPSAFHPEHESIAGEVANLLAVALSEARLRTALMAGRARLRAVIEQLPEGVVVLNEHRRVTLANPAAEALLPCLRPTGDDQPVESLAGVAIADLLDAKVATQDGWSELRVDGSHPRVFEAAARRLAPDTQGTGAVLVIREVTEEHALRQTLQHQESLAAVGQLAAGIAHDFNNLLQGILMYAELLLRGQHLDPRDRERVEGILSQGMRGADLIRQILDFSRRTVNRREPMDLEPFLTSVVRLLRSTIPENIRIDLEVSPGTHRIDGDEAQLQRALTNLAVNARDAMPEGGTLTISLSSLEIGPSDPLPVVGVEPGRWLRLDIRDTGAGIPPDIQPHIFQPFFTTKEVGRGTGLGLAQAYGIVRGHGGFIDLETAVGRGTTFTLYLPEATELATEVSAQAPRPPAEGHGETILLVEDDDSARDVTREGLEALGYRVIAVAEGREALDVWGDRSTEIALVLSDTVMPGMGGVELARELLARTPPGRVVLMSGYPLGHTAGDGLPEGVQDWIQKPFSFEELGRRVRRALTPKS